MTGPPNWYPSTATSTAAEPAPLPSPETANCKPAPVWLQRLSLITFVATCLLLGNLLMVLPWTEFWKDNRIFFLFPRVSDWLQLGPVRGVVSGIGMLDIWIGFSEAIYYREVRSGAANRP